MACYARVERGLPDLRAVDGEAFDGPSRVGVAEDAVEAALHGVVAHEHDRVEGPIDA